MLQFGSVGWLSYDIQTFCQIEINIGKNLIMILYTNKVLIYRRLYFLFTFFCGKIYLVVQNNINELKLKKLQRATKNILKRIQLFWEWTGIFSFFFFVYSYLDKVGKQPSVDNLILDKIQTLFSVHITISIFVPRQ